MGVPSDSCSNCRGLNDDEKQHLRQKLGSLIDQEDAQVRMHPISAVMVH